MSKLREKSPQTSQLSYDMEGHAQKCVERYCELAHKTINQLHKVSTPCLDARQVKPTDLENVGEWSETCSQIVLKCLYLARIGRPVPPWIVNRLTRSVTTWNRACDLRLARVISYIHRTSTYRQNCHVGSRAIGCTVGLFQDADFCRIFDRLNVNTRRCSVYIWIAHVRADFMGLLETNSCIT